VKDITVTDDGEYTIYPNSCDEPVPVYCIMEQNKKWTVRIDYFLILNLKIKFISNTRVYNNDRICNTN
jgi:hypothetical protein